MADTTVGVGLGKDGGTAAAAEHACTQARRHLPAGARAGLAIVMAGPAHSLAAALRTVAAQSGAKHTIGAYPFTGGTERDLVMTDTLGGSTRRSKHDRLAA